jgi:hypothetical protein
MGCGSPIMKSLKLFYEPENDISPIFLKTDTCIEFFLLHRLISDEKMFKNCMMKIKIFKTSKYLNKTAYRCT